MPPKKRARTDDDDDAKIRHLATVVQASRARHGEARGMAMEILESIASFSSKLVASRTVLMAELGSSSRRSSVQTTSSA